MAVWTSKDKLAFKQVRRYAAQRAYDAGSMREVMKKCATKLVIKRMKESALTLMILPSAKVQEYPGAYAEIIQSCNKLRGSKFMQLAVAPDAISKLEETMQWMGCVDAVEFQLLWVRAAQISWKTVCKEYKCGRTRAWCKWMIGINKIVLYLNNHGTSNNR